MVYVDQLRQYPRPQGASARYSGGGVWWCHMFADTHDELIVMADRLWLKAKWLQRPGLRTEHYDLTPAKRLIAVRCGAREIQAGELRRWLRNKTA